MPKKAHVGYTRVSKKQLENYLKGKSFTVKPSDHEDESNTVVKLHYKTKKNLSKLNKNLSMGKGVRINPDDLDEMFVHSGNGIFDSLKSVMSSKLTKGIVKAVAPQVGNIVGQQVKNFTGSDMASNLTKTLINEGAKEAVGNGIFDSMKGVMKSKLTKGIVKAVAPQVANIAAQQVKNFTGSDMASNLTKTLINEGSKEAVGNGFRKKGGSMNPLGGSLNSNQYTGIGYNTPSFSNPSERMAYVRSHRRSNGGVAM
jgi:hypothetical protein